MGARGFPRDSGYTLEVLSVKVVTWHTPDVVRRCHRGFSEEFIPTEVLFGRNFKPCIC